MFGPLLLIVCAPKPPAYRIQKWPSVYHSGVSQRQRVGEVVRLKGLLDRVGNDPLSRSAREVLRNDFAIYEPTGWTKSNGWVAGRVISLPPRRSASCGIMPLFPQDAAASPFTEQFLSRKVPFQPGSLANRQMLYFRAGLSKPEQLAALLIAVSSMIDSSRQAHAD